MIKRVLVAGAGTIGQHIVLVCLRQGYEVMIYDPNPNAMDKAPARLAIVTHLVGDFPMTEEEISKTFAQATLTQDPREAATDVDLLIESVPEDLKLKRKVLKQFNELCPPHTIFTTNSSTIMPSQLAAASGRPSQFAAMHFGQANFVEVMPHPGTAPETLETLGEFARSLDQLALMCQIEYPGQIVNAMIIPLIHAAVSLASYGVVSPHDIDRAWMKATETKFGPFALLDAVGLQTALTIARSKIRPFRDQATRRIVKFYESYVEKGHTGFDQARQGESSFQGFYTYPNPEYLEPGFLKGE